MEIIREWPTWAIVLAGLVAGGALLALNASWLLAAKGVLDAQARKRGTELDNPGLESLSPKRNIRSELPKLDRPPTNLDRPPTNSDGPPASPGG